MPCVRSGPTTSTTSPVPVPAPLRSRVVPSWRVAVPAASTSSRAVPLLFRTAQLVAEVSVPRSRYVCPVTLVLSTTRFPVVEVTSVFVPSCTIVRSSPVPHVAASLSRNAAPAPKVCSALHVCATPVAACAFGVPVESATYSTPSVPDTIEPGASASPVVRLRAAVGSALACHVGEVATLVLR